MEGGTADETAEFAAIATKKGRISAFAATVLLLVLTAASVMAWVTQDLWYNDTQNYRVGYSPPSGWIEIPPGELTLFRFKHPRFGVYIQGFQDQMVHSHRVDPELDADGLANIYLRVTRESLQGWDAERLKDVDTGALKFSLLKRWRPGKLVYLAFATKGNTTLGVSLYASGGEIPMLDEQYDEFLAFLNRITFTYMKYD